MRHIGGSILASNNSEVLKPKKGIYGTFETRVMASEDTHALFFEGIRIASHPNGFSCDVLAKRLMTAWETGTLEDRKHAVAQFDYILDCGGKGERAVILSLAGL